MSDHRSLPGPVDRTLDLLAARSPTLGAGRLLCVDGAGGSGKTTFAAAVAARTGAPVVHLDDLYDGWAGLDGVDTQLGPLLRPMLDGRPGRYRRYDWHARAFAETVEVATMPLLVVEGVGSGTTTVASMCTVLVWLDAPRDVRLARGIARDGKHLREQWLAWQDAEDAHHRAHRTRERADLVVSGTG